MKIYEVGGCVRDEILGIESKDIDFSAVLEDEFFDDGFDKRGNTPFELMTLNLRRQGFKVFLESPQYLTVRAKFPKTGWEKYDGLTADFVLARKEGKYTDGRRPDEVVPGTLGDDLARRDFTMNAIAKDIDGNLIDPFGGVDDIDRGLIRAVGDPYDRFIEDALRAVRALRFSVTKGFDIDENVCDAMQDSKVLDAIASDKISDERIREELTKMFRYNTVESLRMIGEFPLLTAAMFSGRVSLDATMKQRGRG